MNIEEKIYSVLQAAPAVTDLIGARLFPLIATQSRSFPFVVYDLERIDPNHTKNTASVMDVSRFTFICVAETFASVRAVADAMRATLDNYTDTLNSKYLNIRYEDESHSFERAAEVYKIEVDFMFYIQK